MKSIHCSSGIKILFIVGLIIILSISGLSCSGGGDGGGGGDDDNDNIPVFSSDTDYVIDFEDIDIITNEHGEEVELIGKKILIVFNDNANRSDYETLINFLQNNHGTYSVVRRIFLKILILRFESVDNIVHIKSDIKNYDFIEEVYFNTGSSILVSHADTTYFSHNWSIANIQLKKAWAYLIENGYSLSNSDIKIGVLDGPVGSEYFDNKLDETGFPVPRFTGLRYNQFSYHNHGTTVGSLLGADCNNITGVAPDSDILSYDCSHGTGIFKSVLDRQLLGIKTLVDSGAKIINISLGGAGKDDPF